ncbi:TetR/AcrR family transcriptional regulator [Photobacterium lutimaris]|uniref:TetR family transcriptional regulator n=1 Tax=Photobacterium lutimaris TaxID=388278 RepID=A0A2T3J189_9GAMM|nr:TetR/AcrR family transcriptional regulator [Photobacterium lutimaris]PSU34817.1 TetR family transcriptional regulator [Photobacterium lutimaris]TDR77150.1 TetR family transcriptional regulator [Photobacterium lutimaris]
MLTARSAQKREQILQAATELFCEQGYGISMEAIALRAQVSKQTVYSHFKTKDELFDTCIRAKCTANQLDICLLDDPREPQKVLEDFAWRFQNMLLSDEALNTYKAAVRQSDTHPDLASVYLNAGPRNTTEMLAEYLGQLVAKGVLTGDLNCADAAMQFLLMCHGRSVYWAYLGQQSGESEQERKQYLKSTVSMFLQGYKSPKG